MLGVNQNARIDFVLQVGSVKEVVEVTADTPLVDTMDVQLAETVDQQRIENLPLETGRMLDCGFRKRRSSHGNLHLIPRFSFGSGGS